MHYTTPTHRGQLFLVPHTSLHHDVTIRNVVTGHHAHTSALGQTPSDHKRTTSAQQLVT